MRLLLVSNASYDPPRGGSTRSNLAWLRLLGANGHQCRALSASLTGNRQSDTAGLSIRGFAHFERHAHVIAEEIGHFLPDLVLVSSEDLTHMLLREVSRAAAGRLVYL